MRIFDRPHHNWVLSARQFLNVRTLIVEIAKNDNKNERGALWRRALKTHSSWDLVWLLDSVVKNDAIDQTNQM